MKQFVVPEDGFVIKTEKGRPVIDLLVQPEGTTLRLFDADGEARIAFATQGNSGAILIGDPSTEGVVISAGEDVSELAVINSGKHIALALTATNSELRFVNAANATTAKIYDDENGGQIGLADQRGDVTVSAGAGERGGVCCLMNTTGNTVVFLESKENAGRITLLDHSGDIRVLVDNNVHLVDKGRIVWTTMAE